MEETAEGFEKVKLLMVSDYDYNLFRELQFSPTQEVLIDMQSMKVVRNSKYVLREVFMNLIKMSSSLCMIAYLSYMYFNLL